MKKFKRLMVKLTGLYIRSIEYFLCSAVTLFLAGFLCSEYGAIVIDDKIYVTNFGFIALSAWVLIIVGITQLSEFLYYWLNNSK